jgi:hypothetical protein
VTEIAERAGIPVEPLPAIRTGSVSIPSISPRSPAPSPISRRDDREGPLAGLAWVAGPLSVLCSFVAAPDAPWTSRWLLLAPLAVVLRLAQSAWSRRASSA